MTMTTTMMQVHHSQKIELHDARDNNYAMQQCPGWRGREARSKQGQWWQQQATVAMAATDNNRNGGDGQQSTKCGSGSGSGSGSGGDSGCSNSNHGNVVATAAVALADDMVKLTAVLEAAFAWQGEAAAK
jgi:hypothetical protein